MRPRKPNWSTEQKLLLVQLVKTRREDVLTGRHSCRELATTRRWAWDEIAEEISTAYPDVPRTGKECERHWFVELAKAKEAMVTHRSYSGKELAEQVNPVTKLVMEIIKLQRKETDLKERFEEDSTTFQEEEEEEQVEVKYLLAPVVPATNNELPVNHMSNNSQDTAPMSPPCSPSPSAEKRELELSVLRRQERVLQLQEEYYSLKIKHLKARMLMDL
ncbi:uncharacterized protein LOC143521181 isoform X1 [Brachyhypopomus gauderio]|uniref:uncharacterized protein LOC143521181 isoform X1 n=1 Tax=Brachyhypopomus gauderio TaxID=698409 RepID=UPI004042B14D